MATKERILEMLLAGGATRVSPTAVTAGSKILSSKEIEGRGVRSVMLAKELTEFAPGDYEGLEEVEDEVALRSGLVSGPKAKVYKIGAVTFAVLLEPDTHEAYLAHLRSTSPTQTRTAVAKFLNKLATDGYTSLTWMRDARNAAVGAIESRYAVVDLGELYLYNP